MKIDCKKVFIDTAPFIYLIEKDENNPEYHELVKKFLLESYQKDIQLVTSVVTVEEYLVFPYRTKQMIYAEMFEKLLQTLNIEVIAIHEEIAKKAAQIRADYKNFKGMDALQIATACCEGCDLFLTNDKQLKQFQDIICKTVSDLKSN